jgi:hypothetical protein
VSVDRVKLQVLLVGLQGQIASSIGRVAVSVDRVKLQVQLVGLQGQIASSIGRVAGVS